MMTTLTALTFTFKRLLLFFFAERNHSPNLYQLFASYCVTLRMFVATPIMETKKKYILKGQYLGCLNY